MIPDGLDYGGYRMALNIALVYGGRSAEHEVSLRSANTIYGALRQLKHEVHCIGIDRSGLWHYQTVCGTFPQAVDETAPPVSLRLGRPVVEFTPEGASGEVEIELDLLFPALHGPWGEDGTIQGLAAMSNLPCVGSPTLGSALAMDKDVSKRLLRAHGIAVAPWITCAGAMPAWPDVVSELGGVVFVKPAALGSSVGVRRVSSAEEFRQAFEEAAAFGPKIILEKEIRGREIECGVLDTASGPVASDLGEIAPLGSHRFYDYDAKYRDEEGARLTVPADVPPDTRKRIREISLHAFRCLELRTLARIDFFLPGGGEVVLNEANTLPGFTSISMYPKMFESAGYPLERLVDAIVQNTLPGATA